LFRSFLRTFLLQASWNFERMQNLGVLYVLSPALRVFYTDADLREAYHRHMAYFNTHPFMASPVLGATISLEQRRAAGQEGTFGVEDFKSMTMAPYAAIGDALFWGAVRPLAACVALFFAVKGSLLAPIIFLLAFNLPHLWMRLLGFMRGYTLGISVVEIVQRHRLPDLAIRLKEGMVVVLGGLLAYQAVATCRGAGMPAGWGGAALPLVFVFVFFARKGASALLLLSLSLVLLATLFQVVIW
jgi:PTS system mannose-specific IID component